MFPHQCPSVVAAHARDPAIAQGSGTEAVFYFATKRLKNNRKWSIGQPGRGMRFALQTCMAFALHSTSREQRRRRDQMGAGPLSTYGRRGMA